ncbi:MAG: hypothetical protein IPQ07_28260 [Myxococcales bacterium]|nr:hypothetical protein [Myxococcales bacterium]
MKRVLGFLVLALTVWATAGDAQAYPQFQLDRDQTCTGCHISPAGGNLLNENGLAVAESLAQWGTAPEFFYNAFTPPSWLTLGGDFRSAAGYIQAPSRVLTAFPMQYEAYANAAIGHFTIHANVSPRPAQVGNEAATHVWSREHYVMWQQHPGENFGVYARVGRFMPVYGLRLAEHPVYTRRYGGTQLYADTYGAHVALIQPKYEGHLTGFIRDPLIDTVEHSNGVMAYAEVRPTERLALGGEGMFTRSPDAKDFGGGVTAKLFVPEAKLVLQAELQYGNKIIDTSPTNAAGGAPLKLVGYLLASRMLGSSLLLDLGLGHYDSNFRIKNLDRDCVDLNLHWFVDSHVELLLTNRIEMLAFGKGGPSGGYSLLQFHYRL